MNLDETQIMRLLPDGTAECFRPADRDRMRMRRRLADVRHAQPNWAVDIGIEGHGYKVRVFIYDRPIYLEGRELTDIRDYHVPSAEFPTVCDWADAILGTKQ